VGLESGIANMAFQIRLSLFFGSETDNRNQHIGFSEPHIHNFVTTCKKDPDRKVRHIYSSSIFQKNILINFF